ncbi:MAG: MFS transporter [Xanthobacteraceae bacterium]
MSIPSIETRSSWVIASVSLVLLATSFGALWIVAVGLKAIAADLGGARSAPSLASSLAWLGSSVGGLFMGPLAERYGIRLTVIIGGVSVCIGLLISTLGSPWHLYIGHGVFIGLLGTAGLNAPLYIYVSRWFDRRRGSALALLSSGLYLAGTIWPPVFERAIAYYGWQQTMIAYGLFTALLIVPMALWFLRAAPEVPVAAGAAGAAGETPRVFGWPPNVVFGMLAAASFLCCVTMSMPQNHLVALCTDLGYSAQSGAAMLSLLLGLGVLGRQIWGAISDKIGGLSTLLISSLLQGLAMAGFVVTQSEAGLYGVAAAFGVGFSALIPAYVLAVREYFPAREASWRVPVVLLLSGSGMATGTWLAGALYDSFGFYAPAFAAGVFANILNFIVIGTLVLRRRYAGREAVSWA